jgi:hypothetical protein
MLTPNPASKGVTPNPRYLGMWLDSLDLNMQKTFSIFLFAADDQFEKSRDERRDVFQRGTYLATGEYRYEISI